MPAKKSFDIDGLMVFRSDLTAVDQDGNIVNGVTTPDRYFPSDREPLSGEQIGRYTNTTAYWREHSTYIPLKGDVIIYSDGGSIEQGGVTVYVPKIKVGDGVTSIGNLPFTDSDNQGGGTEDVLVCTFTLNSGSTIYGTMDKTDAEILAAANAGKSVICVVSNGSGIYYLFSKNVLTFCRILSATSEYIAYDTSNSRWEKHSITLQQLLVSGTNIKTINGNSLLGNGNLIIGGVTIYSGSSAPSSETGSNGDIYIQEMV